MNRNRFWEIIKRFNSLMNSAIEGPNCLKTCKGDCCSIKINVPKILAEEYVKRGYADKDDFIRSDIFSFKLRFDEKKRKCFLFDKNLNGCLVHNSGIKPPQCWIYPTKFTNSKNKPIRCKKANGWKIIDTEKTKEAEELLKYYTFLCQLEAKKEIKNISQRINNGLLESDLNLLLRKSSPSQIAGIKDTWDNFKILPAEGISLQIKRFCQIYNEKCSYVDNFLKCKKLCEKVINGLVKFLQQNLNEYVKKEGPDTDGEYSFIKLFKFIESNNHLWEK